MIIGIDIDDTICNTYEIMFHDGAKYTIEELGRSGKIHKGNLNTHMYCKDMYGWSFEEATDFLNKYYESIMKEVRPIKYVAEVIKKLRQEGNKIYLITARFTNKNFDIKEVTKRWLRDNNIDYDEIFFDCTTKADLVKEKNVDIFIDDSFLNCEEVSKLGIKTYIFNTIVNENLENENIERVYSWPHVYQQIKKFKEES